MSSCPCSNDIQITPPPYELPPCVDGEPCEELVRAACVVYDNDNIPTGSIIQNDDRLSEIVEKTVVTKVYNALLNQTGNATELDNESYFVIGNQYIVVTLLSGDDFSNIGYVADGIPFTATGTTPIDWSAPSIVYDVTNTIPTAIVLANTLGGPVTYTNYLVDSDEGEYLIKSNALFTENKTQIFIGSEQNIDTDSWVIATKWINSSTIKLVTGSSATSADRKNEGLLNTSIEIKIFS